MTPLAKSQNLAARMGRWSAAHRKTAIFGWLAFVLVALVLGSVVGSKSLEPADAEAGDAGRALQMIDDGGFADTADESVFVEHGSLPASSPEFKAVVDKVVAELSAADGVSRIRSPLDDPEAGLPRRPGRARPVRALRHGLGGGRADRADSRVRRRRRGRQPRLHRRRLRLGKRREVGERHHRLRLPAGRVHGRPADARHPAARLRRRSRRRDPAAARPLGRRGGARPPGDPEPVRPDGRGLRLDHPADRPRGRRRLLALLPQARA